MPKKPEEIQSQKEYAKFLTTRIYKLTRQEKYLQNQLTRTQTKIKEYEKEKKKIEKLLEK
jgi:predicted RNase H-like nuclease (RuvC/YqgF family)